MNPDVSLLATRVLSGDMKLHEALARLTAFKDKALLMRWFHSKQLTGRSLKKSLRGDLWVRVDVPDLIKGYHHDRMKNPKNWSRDSKGDLTYKVGNTGYRIEDTPSGYRIHRTKDGFSVGNAYAAEFASEDEAAATAAQHRKADWRRKASPERRAAHLHNWEKMDHAPLDWDDDVTDKYASVHGFTRRDKFNSRMKRYRDRGASFARHRGSMDVGGGDFSTQLTDTEHQHSTLYAVHQKPGSDRWTLSIHPHQYNITDTEAHRHGFASKEAAQRAAAEHAKSTRARAFERGAGAYSLHSSLGFGGYRIFPTEIDNPYKDHLTYRIYDRGSKSTPGKRWGMHIGHINERQYSEENLPVVSHHATRKDAHAAALRHISMLKDYGKAGLPIGSPKDVQSVIHNAVDRETLPQGVGLSEHHKIHLNPAEHHILDAIIRHKYDSGNVRSNLPDHYRVMKALGRAPRASRDHNVVREAGRMADTLYRGTGIPRDWLHHFKKVGNKFNAGDVSPWTADKDITQDFAEHGRPDPMKRGAGDMHGLIFHLKNPKFGTDISQIHDYAHEQEHVTGGNFRITKVLGEDANGHHNVEIEHLPKAEQPKGWFKQSWEMYGKKAPPAPSTGQLSLKLDKSISDGEWVPQEVSDYLAEALLRRPPRHIRRLASIDRHISKAWVAGMDDYEADGADPNSPDSARHGKPLRGPYNEPLKKTQKLREAAKRIKNS